jgi:hypothetical protein
MWLVEGERPIVFLRLFMLGMGVLLLVMIAAAFAVGQLP